MEKINSNILKVAKLGDKTGRSYLSYVHRKDNYIEATDGIVLLREYLPTNADKETLIDYVSETEAIADVNYPETNRVIPCKESLHKLERTIWDIANMKYPTKESKEIAILNGSVHFNATYIKLIASFFKDEEDVTAYSTDEDITKGWLYFESNSKCAIVCPFRVKFPDDELLERKGIAFKDFADGKKSKAPTQIYVVKDPATGDILKAFKTRASAELYMSHRGDCEMVPVVLA